MTGSCQSGTKGERWRSSWTRSRHRFCIVIPYCEVQPSFIVPPGARLPSPEEVDEEGYGYFRNVWLIRPGVPLEEAASVLAWERQAVGLVDSLVDTAGAFDRAARVIEDFSPDEEELLVTPADYPGLSQETCERLRIWLSLQTLSLGGLDLGIAGMVYALSARGFFPVASCRGHADDSSWSLCPVVIFAGSTQRLGLLRRTVIRAGCSLGDASGNGRGLVAVHGPSIGSMMMLAEMLLRMKLPQIEPAALDLM